MTLQEVSKAKSSPQTPVSFEDLKTERMDLVAITAESLHCQVANEPGVHGELGRLLDCSVPDLWPPEHWEPHVFDFLLKLFDTDPEGVGWCRYLMLRKGDGSRVLMGTCGALFPREETGEAEIGYGLLAEFQRQGYAAEAVLSLLPWLRRRRPVKAFVAQTFPHLYGSIRVLEKCGFVYAGKGFDEGAVLYREAVPGNGQSGREM